MNQVATNRSFDFLDRLMTENGALVTILFILLVAALAAVAWLVRERNRAKVTLDADATKLADERVKAQKEHCDREIAAIRESHLKELHSVRDAHLKEVKLMQEDHARISALLEAMRALIDRILKVLEGFRQDFQRLYDGNKDTSDRAYMNNTEVVKAITTMAGVVGSIPTMLENIILKQKDQK